MLKAATVLSVCASMLAGCVEPAPHVVVTIVDELGVAGNAVAIVFGYDDREDSKEVELGGQGFSHSVVVVSDGEETVGMWVNAVDANGAATARGHTTLIFKRGTTGTARVELTGLCEYGHPDGTVCVVNEAEATRGTCSAGDCIPQLLYCGDGIVCGGTCLDWGFEGGVLSCNEDCTYDLSDCELAPKPVASISARSGATCALLKDSSVKCWGWPNQHGELGLGDKESRGVDSGVDGYAYDMGNNLPVVDLGTGIGAAAVARGQYHTCALLEDNTVKCWGSASYGQLGLGDRDFRGDGPAEMGDQLPGLSLGSGLAAEMVFAGGANTCAVFDDGTAKCWGNNFDGQLGLGDEEHRGDELGEMGDDLPFLNLGTGRTVEHIAVGGSVHVCAILDNRQVKCWGDNSKGQLGMGDTSDRGDGAGEMGDALPAVDLGSGTVAELVVAGGEYTCALLLTGAVKCWGSNAFGQLGLGDIQNRGDDPNEMGNNLPAIDFGAGRTAKQLAAGWGHVCALLDNNAVKCWGSNYSGQLGLGDNNSHGDGPDDMGDRLPFLDLGAGRTATQLVAGDDYTCALLDDDSVRCWGAALHLGIGAANNRGDEPGEMGDSLPPVRL